MTTSRRVSFSRLHAVINRPSILVQIGFVGVVTCGHSADLKSEIEEFPSGIVFRSTRPISLEEILCEMEKRTDLSNELSIFCEASCENDVRHLYVFF